MNPFPRIKIISMGNAEVGKSCIIKRYCEKRFVSKYLITVGIDYGVAKLTIRDREIKINIFDMGGHPIFYEVRNEFYENTQGVLLVFDVTDKSSFDSLDKWMEEMKSELNCNHGNNNNNSMSSNPIDRMEVVVCANKIDKHPRQVSEMDGRLFCDSRGFHYIETSALSGEGVNAAFDKLFENVVNTVETGKRSISINYNKEQLEAIIRLKNSKNNYERLGIDVGSTRDEINRAYKRLAILLHPDKNVAPGSEEAFKILVAARTELLKIT